YSCLAEERLVEVIDFQPYRPHRDKQTAVFTLYLFAAASPRQANSSFHALSIRGSLTVTSKQRFSRFIYSRLPLRDKQTAAFTRYLFAAAAPSQPTCALHSSSILASLTVTSKQQFSRFIYSRQPHRDKQTAVFALYLFAAASPRQANSSFRALSIRGSLIGTNKRQFSRFIYSVQSHRDS